MRLNVFTLLLIAFSCKGQEKRLPEVQPINHPSVISEEFIYELADALTPECHASTVEASGDAIVAAWFGGTEEKNKDVGIWVSRKTDADWSTPVEVVNGVQEDGTRHPCWNPVLFKPKGQPLHLFYQNQP